MVSIDIQHEGTGYRGIAYESGTTRIVVKTVLFSHYWTALAAAKYLAVQKGYKYRIGL